MNNEDAMEILRHMAIQRIMMEQKTKSYFAEVFEEDDDLHRLEHDPNIKTTVTDRDMLLLHIDIALDERDEVAFKALARELEGAK